MPAISYSGRPRNIVRGPVRRKTDLPRGAGPGGLQVGGRGSWHDGIPDSKGSLIDLEAPWWLNAPPRGFLSKACAPFVLKKVRALSPSPDPKVAVIDLGYVGLPLAVVLSRHFEVDVDRQRIDALGRGWDRTREVDPDVLRAATLVFTADAAAPTGWDLFIATVPTPVEAGKRPDLRNGKVVDLFAALSDKSCDVAGHDPLADSGEASAQFDLKGESVGRNDQWKAAA